ncbi:MAG: acyltransferase [Nitrosomonas sp.]|nr:acyltransferase [Nitrosomonas sp.]
MLADEFAQLGKHMAAGAAFVSNFALWQEAGYFDNAAETKPLLHLWSLAIEEQFYIFWPLMVWVSWKRKAVFFILLVLVMVVSFAMNMHLIHTDKTAAFFFSGSRIWELLVGVSLAFITARPIKIKNRNLSLSATHRQALSVIGALLLAVAFYRIDKSRPFPGTWALLPLVGVFCLIAAGPQTWFNRYVLGNRTLVGVGLISYPLYLWHWPVLTFARLLTREAPSEILRIAALTISFFLAWLTYQFIEKPIRLGNANIGKPLILCVFMFILGATGYFTFYSNGFVNRTPSGNNKQAFLNYFQGGPPDWEDPNKTAEKCSFYDLERKRNGKTTDVPKPAIAETCYTRNSQKKSVLVWGNSYAIHLYAGLKKNLPDDWQILQVASPGCAPELENAMQSKVNYCNQSNWFAIETIQNTTPDVVVIAQDIEQSSIKYNAMAEKLLSLGVKKIIIAGALPQWEADLYKIVATDFWNAIPRRTFRGVHKETIDADKKFKAGLKLSNRVVFADLMSAFCNNEGCLTYLGSDVKLGLTTWDGGHLSPMSSEYLAEQYLVNLIVNTADVK